MDDDQATFEAEAERADQSTWRNFASVYAEGFDSWARTVEGAKPENKLTIFELACREAVTYVSKGLAQPDAIDALVEIAQLNDIADEQFQEIIGRAFPSKTNGSTNGANGRAEYIDEQAEWVPPPQPALTVPILSPFPIVEEDIPVRQWVIPGFLLREMLTVLVAPSGSGKSLLTLQVAIALATGREWAGWRPRGTLRVLIVNAEDDTNEIKRRLAAAVVRMGISEEQQFEISSMFWIADNPNGVVLAKFNNQKKILVRTPLMDELVSTITNSRIDVVFVDPFAETFEGDENSNSELKWAGMLWREVARRTGAAVCLVHHTKKYASGMAGDVDAARGASALIGIARIVSTLFPMSQKEAEALGVTEDQRGNYLRYDDAKTNLNLKSPVAKWFKKESVLLRNATDELPGDYVGVLEPWKPENAFDIMSEPQILEFFRAVDVGVLDSRQRPTGELYTFSNTGASESELPRYIAQFIQDFFKLKTLASAIEIMKTWRKNKRLVEVTYRSPKQRRERRGVRSELYQNNVVPFVARDDDPPTETD